MAGSFQHGFQGGEFHANMFTDCNIQTVVIGNGTVVHNYCRCLDFPERSTPHQSARKTAFHDGDQCGSSRGSEKVVNSKCQSRIPFCKQKFRANPKKASSESEEETLLLNSPKMFPVVPRDEQNTAKSLKKFYLILNRLHPLRDGGNWKGFDEDSRILQLENQGDSELQMLLAMEKSVIVSYQSDLDQAETMVLEVLQKLRKTNVIHSVNYHFLVSMAYIHLTGFYRRLNKHGEARKCIATAEQNFRLVNSRFLKALIFYEMASNLTKYISTLPSDVAAREQLVSDATNYMKQCIDLCMELDDGHVYIKKHHFALVKLALMALNCRTRPSRSQSISSKFVDDAKNCLKTVEEKYWHEMSEGQLIQFLKAKSDLNFRLNHLQDAERYGRDALHLAETSGFSLEPTEIKERLHDICRLRSSETLALGIPVSQEEHHESLSSSTSPSYKNSPKSSDNEMEVV